MYNTTASIDDYQKADSENNVITSKTIKRIQRKIQEQQ